MSNLPTWLDVKYCTDRFRPLKNRKWIPPPNDRLMANIYKR